MIKLLPMIALHKYYVTVTDIFCLHPASGGRHRTSASAISPFGSDNSLLTHCVLMKTATSTKRFIKFA